VGGYLNHISFGIKIILHFEEVIIIGSMSQRSIDGLMGDLKIETETENKQLYEK